MKMNYWVRFWTFFFQFWLSFRSKCQFLESIVISIPIPFPEQIVIPRWSCTCIALVFPVYLLWLHMSSSSSSIWRNVLTRTWPALYNRPFSRFNSLPRMSDKSQMSLYYDGGSIVGLNPWSHKGHVIWVVWVDDCTMRRRFLFKWKLLYVNPSLENSEKFMLDV